MMMRPAYPENWEALARACKERASWQCEHCGAKQHEIRTSKRGSPYFIYLHAAHALHCSKSDPDPQLICLCISCHSRLDYARKQRDHRVKMECLRHLRILVEQGIVEIKMEYK